MDEGKRALWTKLVADFELGLQAFELRRDYTHVIRRV